MNDNQIIAKLIRIARNQQQIIAKLAAGIENKQPEEEMSKLEAMKADMEDLRKAIETLDSNIIPTRKLLDHQGLPIDVLRAATGKYKSYESKRKDLTNQLLGLKHSIEVIEKVPTPVIKNEPEPQLNLLKKKIDNIKTLIKKLNTDKDSLTKVIKMRGVKSKDLESTNDKIIQINERLMELYTTLEAEEKRAEKLANPQVIVPPPEEKAPATPTIKRPVEFILPDKSVRDTALTNNQLQKMLEYLGAVPHQLEVKKRPDGSEFIEVKFNTIDHKKFPPFLKHIIDNAEYLGKELEDIAMDFKALTKLVKIARNQQQMIEKVAGGLLRERETRSTDPNEDYIRRSVQSAAVNAHLKMVGYQVAVAAAQGANIPVGYVVSVSGATNNNAVRQAFIDALKKQVATQKPELVANLSIVFTS
jgi:DNA repair exonuclease SbcCD ATPase subunit